ncbi:MAG TPA: lipopolysaccharide kinase InaA family protein [Planctomycetota bacterium]|nr:lipopolysaccharide kinase InaA family protein [Planctomycetota bacterium]
MDQLLFGYGLHLSPPVVARCAAKETSDRRQSTATARQEHQVVWDYTLVETVSTRIPKSLRQVRGSPQLGAWAGHLPDPAALIDADLGAAVTEARSSRVRRLATDRGTVFVKVYEYVTWRSRLRDFGKRTGPLSRSRAAREFDALKWMRDRGVPAPEPLAVFEARRCGFLQCACLVTTAFPGEASDTLLPGLGAAERHELAEAIGRLVGTLHRLGFRDRNLDLRNLLAQRTATGWIVAKIDSPRHRLARTGRRSDALTRADWRRLCPQLDAFGLARIAQRAADAQ